MRHLWKIVLTDHAEGELFETEMLMAITLLGSSECPSWRHLSIYIDVCMGGFREISSHRMA